MTGRPQSLGLEDRFMGLYTEAECKEKLSWLLDRLVLLLVEDGRKPTLIKVTVRDYYKDKLVKKFHKESRQGKISARLFQLDSQGNLSEESKSEILQNALGLLGKMVDFTDSFHITLMGLGVSNFLEQVEKKGSIKNFFISPKKDDGLPQSVPTTSLVNSKRKNIFQDTEESDTKKSKICTSETKESSKNTLNNDLKATKEPEGIEKNAPECPPDYDPKVWEELPLELRKELISTQSSSHKTENTSSDCSTKQEQESTSAAGCSTESTTSKGDIDKDSESLTHEKEPEPKINNDEVSPSKMCPEGVDKEVFAQLPTDIRREISKSMSAKSNLSSSNKTPNVSTINSKGSKKKSPATAISKSHSILSYFSRQK
eukprot:TRINITY_DN14612_c0_g1_i13.p1 TRINITY_DN14612_c0_g1~~TRINITY_DN14612_c0_g1_i13.p1  ORF type:complete len:401 (-),score=76.80 TRINITY_DN14612_c0_g1_i13:220-1335(-)